MEYTKRLNPPLRLTFLFCLFLVFGCNTESVSGSGFQISKPAQIVKSSEVFGSVQGFVTNPQNITNICRYKNQLFGVFSIYSKTGFQNLNFYLGKGWSSGLLGFTFAVQPINEVTDRTTDDNAGDGSDNYFGPIDGRKWKRWHGWILYTCSCLCGFGVFAIWALFVKGYPISSIGEYLHLRNGEMKKQNDSDNRAA